MPAKSPEWFLIEIFGQEQDPTVISRGSTTKPFLALDKAIRSTTHRKVVAEAIKSIKTGTPSRRDFTLGMTRYIFIPLLDFTGHTQAVLVHYGDPDVPVSPEPACGAWYFNASTGEASGSHELLDLYHASQSQRRRTRPMHEVFERLVCNDPIATRKLIDKTPGVTHQATETVQCDDGSLWIASYSCRFVRCEDQIHLHGVTRKVGSYEPGSGAPSPYDLLFQVATAGSPPNIFRAVIDPSTGNLLHSYDPYPPCMKDICNIDDALQGRDEIDTMRRLIHLCAHDQVILRDLDTTDTTGRNLEIDLSPIGVDGKTAVLATLRLAHK